MNGKPLKFDFHGLYNAVVTMYDRETESVWLQVGGRAIKGPMTGTVLKSGPLLDTTWKQWKELHPDTLVMSPDNAFQQYYAPKGRKPYRGSPNGFPAPYFRESLTHGDRRLGPNEMILALALKPSEESKVGDARAEAKPEEKPKPAVYRAYTLKTLKETAGVLNDTLGAIPVGILFDPMAETATAVSRMLDGRTLTLEGRKQDDGAVAYYDKETGTRWNIEGKGVDGPLKDKQLRRLDSHMSEWYGWVSYFPETSIYGREDPPQPLDLYLPDGLTPEAKP